MKNIFKWLFLICFFITMLFSFASAYVYTYYDSYGYVFGYWDSNTGYIYDKYGYVRGSCSYKPDYIYYR